MATIYDVAKLAGVSHTSVSAVIHNRPIRMKEATRQRILDAANTLSYKANRAAQQLSTGKFNTIALCFGGISSQIFNSGPTNKMMAGIAASASEIGLSLLLAPVRRGYNFEEMIAKMPSEGVDGGIVVGPISFPENGGAANNRCSIPLVCIDGNLTIASANNVDTDNFLGMKRGAEYLISMGHKKMVYISPTPQYQCLVDRMRGFYQAVNEAHLPLADQVTHILQLEDVPTVIRQSAATNNGPTALICAEEATTFAVLDEAARLGLHIPGDLSILSYDDAPGHTLSESINIIRNDFFSMGEAATNLLWKLIKGECLGPVSIQLSAELVIRTP